MHCHLFIPDFSSAEGDEPDRLVAAETLFAKGRRRRLAASPREAWLFERFAVPKQRDWPVAPYTLLADGGAPERDFWLRADPVHLRLGRDTLTFADGAAFEVSRAEAEALVETLNRHFGDAMLFYPLQPARWYVRLPGAPDMRTTPPSAVREETIEGNLPSGPDAMRFHAVMNEAQMLLHEHPVNAGREERGEPVLNSVWFWGGGVIDAAKSRPFSTVFGDDPLARGLALAAGIPARALPKDAGAVLAAAGDEGVALVVLDPPRSAASERRAALERDWFGPFLAALQSGQIGMLTLSLPSADSLLEIETVRSDLRYFWRLKRQLADYLGSRA
ncbi:MAG: hypothetical protein E6H75_00015 [Betaproteobacteria bacterium]|nr:MAG: hypothetical protein E6H75_00015 [Betaproteobacteria bacterium]